MKLSQFKFDLPQDLVALYPHSSTHTITRPNGTTAEFDVVRPDEARLMVLHKQSETIDLYHKDEEGNPIEGDYILFKDLVNYFGEGDTFVFNDTKVFPARLYGTKEKTDAKIEVFLLRELNPEMRLWDVLVEPARKIRIGNKLFFEESGTMVAEVIDNTTSRGRTLRFLYDCPHDEFKKELFAWARHHCPDISSTTVRRRKDRTLPMPPKRTWSTSRLRSPNTRALSRHPARASTSRARCSR